MGDMFVPAGGWLKWTPAGGRNPWPTPHCCYLLGTWGFEFATLVSDDWRQVVDGAGAGVLATAAGIASTSVVCQLETLALEDNTLPTMVRGPCSPGGA